MMCAVLSADCLAERRPESDNQITNGISVLLRLGALALNLQCLHKRPSKPDPDALPAAYLVGGSDHEFIRRLAYAEAELDRCFVGNRHMIKICTQVVHGERYLPER